MATILLTDEEYAHIQGLMNDLVGKVQQASPRAATHYSNVAKMHAEFIAREDGKRAVSKTKVGTRDSIQRAKEARRASLGSQAQAAQSQSRTGTASTSKSA